MKIIIIGAVAAGSKAAFKLRRLLPQANITVYTDDTNVSYSSCGLPYYIQGNFQDYKFLLVRTVDDFRKSGIDVYLKHKVININISNSELTIYNELDNIVRKANYDKLIIATGARPFIPNINNIGKYNNVYSVRKIEDGINIRNKLLKSQNAIIIGSGYIGLELLEGLVKNNIFVNVIEKKATIMPIFDSDISFEIIKRLDLVNNKNFKIHNNKFVVEVIGNDNEAKAVQLNTGEILETDFIVIAAGVVPNSEIAKEAGIEIGLSGAIKVNKLMRTSVENIYACGDCCEEPNIINGVSTWIPLGSTANKEGRCAAINVAGFYDSFEGVLGSSVSRCLNTTIAITGFTEKEAKKYGYNPVSAFIRKNDKVEYMPDVDEFTLKVIADKSTGLLLGAQGVGSIGVDRRINSFASALIGHLTVKDFKNNDFTYSPAYSTTIDPLLDSIKILCTKINVSC